MHIVRVPLGSCGLALDDGRVRFLLPGVHVRCTDAAAFEVHIPARAALGRAGAEI